jgi:Tol biopolymer transport system component
VLLAGAATAEPATVVEKPGLIVFASDRDGASENTFDVFRMRGDGRGFPRELTDVGGDNLMPAWSADGARIAFVSSSLTGQPDLHVMNANGSDGTQLTDDLLFDVEPTWFPGGDRIALSKSEKIYTMPAGRRPPGRDLTRLTRQAGVERQPSVSPDGKRIAFVSDRDGDFDLYVIEVVPGSKAKRPVKLTDNTTDDSYPDWSPDGKRLSFSSGEVGERDVYVMKAAPQGRTNRPVNLTDAAGDDSDPTWSPGGKKLAFVSDRTGDDEIWTMEADGTDPTNLTGRPDSQDIQPDWRPLP